MQIGEFKAYLEGRIDRHSEKMVGALARHRVLIKTERAEAEVIMEAFLEILNAEG